MDYFKSAATALLSKASPLPNYTIGERDPWFEGKTIWSLHQGIRRDDGSSCSILVFDLAQQSSQNGRSSKSCLPLAKNTLRKLRTTRHPDVVKLLNSAETPTAIYIAIESVKPLGKALEEMKAKVTQREEWIGWGLSKIASAIKFLNADAATTHGTIRIDSVFMASSGEWRLGGFELTTAKSDQDATLYTHGNLIPEANRYAPPEVRQGGWAALRDMEAQTLDYYTLGLLICEVYNGSLPPAVTATPAQGRIPTPIYQLVRRMTLPNAKSRLTSAQFLAAGQAEGGFFVDNRLFKVASGLDGFVLAREEERLEIMRQLKTSADSFPPEFLQYKVLPALVNALQLASNTAQQGTVSLNSSLQPTRILPLVLQLGSPLSSKEWHQSVAPLVLKAYTSPDRSVRMTLLECLDLYADRIEGKLVSDKLWPNLCTGFGDSAAVIREATVKAILPLSSKLSERILNNDLLRQLARTQVDVEASIRTNTTILLGSLAPKLSLQTRRKVLVPAFSRSLKDPFVHARNAGLMALMATSESFDGEDSAKLILPAVCPCLVDAELLVRDQAKAVLKVFLKKAEDLASQLPETAAESQSLSIDKVRDLDSAQSVIASTASGAASALASWTYSQLSKPAATSGSLSSNGGVSWIAEKEVRTAPLVTASDPSSTVQETDADISAPPVWSQQGDLMDVQDDEDDWSGFQTGMQQINLTTKKSKTKGKLGIRAVDLSSGSSNTPAPILSSTTQGKLALSDSVDLGSEIQDNHLVPPTQILQTSLRSSSPASIFAEAPSTWEPAQSPTNDSRDEINKSFEKAVGNSVPLSKDEKKAELERKREERRQRMAALKTSKAAKLASGLA